MFDLNTFLNTGKSPKLMAIINATGDSFSEGLESSPDSALERALLRLSEGADIIDIGGESTRPGAPEISEALEIARAIPILEELKRRRPEAVVSIDTRHAGTAAAALEAGADIINDVSLLRMAPELPAMVARFNAALVLCHSRGTPASMLRNDFCEYPDGVAKTVAAELAEAGRKAVAAGVAPGNILFDPGFGFAKNPAQNWELMRQIDELFELGPLLAGVSRKSFLGLAINEPEPLRRLGATLGIELEMARRGVAVLRTHDVRELHNALTVQRKLRGESES